MENKHPEVKIDWERLVHLPYFPIDEIMEFLFGLEIDFLKAKAGEHKDQYHLKASLTFWKLLDWILRDMQMGKLKDLSGVDSQNTCFVASEILEWLIDRKIIQWLIDKGIQVPVETMKYFNFETPASSSGPQNKKPAHPAPTTGKAARSALKSKARMIYKKLQNKDRQFTYKDILNHPDWPEALEDSAHKGELPKKTLQNWITEFRKADNSTSF